MPTPSAASSPASCPPRRRRHRAAFDRAPRGLEGPRAGARPGRLAAARWLLGAARAQVLRASCRRSTSDLSRACPPAIPARALLALPGAFTLGVDPRATVAGRRCARFDLVAARRRAASRAAATPCARCSSRSCAPSTPARCAAVEPGGVATSWGKVAGPVACAIATRSSARPYPAGGQPLGRVRRSLRREAAQARLRAVQRASAHGLPLRAAPGARRGRRARGHRARSVFVVADPATPLRRRQRLRHLRRRGRRRGARDVTMVANARARRRREPRRILTACAAQPPAPAPRGRHALLRRPPALRALAQPGARRPRGSTLRGAAGRMPPEPLWSSSPPASLGVGRLPLRRRA